MVFMRPYLLRGMILPAFFLFLTAGVAISDPMPVGGPGIMRKRSWPPMISPRRLP
jgi:hypothetical protein